MSTAARSMPSASAVSRREFTLEAVTAILVGCVITITDTGCGSSSTTPTAVPPADVAGVVSANHAAPHAVTITGVQISAGAAIAAMNIQGQATHNHTLSITAAHLTSLKNKQPISIDSTNDASHQHTVTFTPV
jgi:hypothetical protein